MCRSSAGRHRPAEILEYAVMTASRTIDPPAAAGPARTSLPRRWARAAGRSLVYCALLLPVAIAALVVVLLGRKQRAVAWWRALRGTPTAVRQPGTVAVAGHALASLLLGIVALVPLALEVTLLLRGALYGFVDPGPYGTSWGGPTLAGAWLTHFLLGIPFALVGFAALAGLAALHRRLTASLDGERTPGWMVPVVGLTGVAATLLVVAWTRQL